jgi:hypothetical protein
MEPEPEPEWPSDGEVAELVRRRHAARLSGDFAASDAIRAGCAVLGVFLVDTVLDEASTRKRVVETRHAAPVDGISWIRARVPASSGCKFWRHKSRSYCGAQVAGIQSSAAEVWAALQQHARGCGGASGSPAEWLDLSRLHYCAGCIARQRLAMRCPCPFDPRHSILLTKLGGHLRLCQSRPGVSAAVAAGEDGAAVPRGGAADAAQRGVHALCSTTAPSTSVAEGADAARQGVVLVPADADADAVTAAMNDLPLLTALAERMAAAISALPGRQCSSDPLPVRTATRETQLLRIALPQASIDAPVLTSVVDYLYFCVHRVAAQESGSVPSGSGSYERIQALEEGLPVVPLEHYRSADDDSGSGSDAHPPAYTCNHAKSNGGSSRHDAQHVSICHHLGAIGALPIGSTPIATESGDRTQPSGVSLREGSATDLCLIEFCAGKALLAKQACTMLDQAPLLPPSPSQDGVPVPTSGHPSLPLPRQPRVDVVLVDRTEVRHDAFMAVATGTQHDASPIAAAAQPPSPAAQQLEQNGSPSPPSTSTPSCAWDWEWDLHHARLTVDIADLCLERLPQFQRVQRSVAMGKHLCGVATDLTLRCYVRALAAADVDAATVAAAAEADSANAAVAADGADSCSHVPAGSASGQGVTGGLALALCCHHLCDYTGYTDTQWLRHHGIAAGEFALMKRLATKYRAHPCRQQQRPRDHTAAAAGTSGYVRTRLQHYLYLVVHDCSMRMLRAQPPSATA